MFGLHALHAFELCPGIVCSLFQRRVEKHAKHAGGMRLGKDGGGLFSLPAMAPAVTTFHGRRQHVNLSRLGKHQTQ
jgi:hypothetical protein